MTTPARIAPGVPGVEVGKRVLALDALRGVAIVLMVVDHVAMVYPAPAGVREVLTRIALPLFMVLAGYLWRGELRERHLHLVLAAACSIPLMQVLGGPSLPILVVLLLVYPFLWLSARWPVTVAALAVLQVSAWPLGWSGYEPGVVLALLVLGQLARRVDNRELHTLGRHLGPGFALVGRYPLTVYIGHLAVLALLVNV